MGDFKKWGDPNNGGRMTLEWGVDNPLRTTIHVFCNSFITRAVFSTQVFQFLVEIFPFGFYLVNFECGAYLAFDHSLVNCIYPKIFILFFSLILSLIPVLKPSDSIHISVAFCFLLLDLLEFCYQSSPACKPCLSIFNSQRNKCYPIQTKET